MSSFNIVEKKAPEDKTQIAKLDEQRFFYQGLILAVSQVLNKPVVWAQDLHKIGIESLVKSLAPEFLSKPYIYGDISTNNKPAALDPYRGSAAIKIEISQRNTLSLSMLKDCGAAPDSCSVEYIDDILLVFTYELKDEINRILAGTEETKSALARMEETNRIFANMNMTKNIISECSFLYPLVSKGEFSYHLFFKKAKIDDICAFGQMTLEFKH